MTDAHIEKILKAYKSREDMDKFAHLAAALKRSSRMTITSISHAMWTPLRKKKVSHADIVAKINQTNAIIETQTASLLDMLSQLHGTTPEADAELKKFVEEFKGGKVWGRW